MTTDPTKRFSVRATCLAILIGFGIVPLQVFGAEGDQPPRPPRANDQQADKPKQRRRRPREAGVQKADRPRHGNQQEEGPGKGLYDLGDLEFLLPSLNVLDRVSLQEAVEELKGERFDKAEALLKVVVDKSPQAEARGIAAVLLARLLREQKKGPEAVEVLKLPAGRAAPATAWELLQCLPAEGKAEAAAKALHEMIKVQKTPLDRCRILSGLLDVFTERGEELEPEMRETLLQVTAALKDAVSYKEAMKAAKVLAHERTALQAWREAVRRRRAEKLRQARFDRFRRMFGGNRRRPRGAAARGMDKDAEGKGAGGKGEKAGRLMPPEVREKLKHLRDMEPAERRKALEDIRAELEKRLEKARDQGNKEAAATMEKLLRRMKHGRGGKRRRGDREKGAPEPETKRKNNELF